MTVGENIQRLRKKLGLSQEGLAEKLFLTRQTVSQWETDQTTPTLDNIKLLKDVFGVSTDEILGFNDRPEAVRNT
ncbi:MAG: helix-turn-helix transcriptional regulator, partial [Clostridia bacterium]|nr:helix-turn-helix transcriptional regulator [Clostridia bacterium]